MLPIEILKCPISGSDLRLLSTSEVDRLSIRAQGGEILHADGSPVQVDIEGALAATDALYCYAIKDGIALLLSSLALVPRDRPKCTAKLKSDKQRVQQFYNDVGWQQGSSGNFVDAEKWEDLRDVSAEYIRRCHRRVAEHLPDEGEFLLDAASGPVQYDEYVEYSRGYKKRICVDISFAALQKAKRKLGQRGVYIVGDVTNLPLKDDAVDGVVSLHTIYHVPADEQEVAIAELARVLKPTGSGVVVYNWRGRAGKLAMIPARFVQAPLKLVQKLLGRKKRRATAASNFSSLYFYAHPYRWFVSKSWKFEYEIRVWRSVSVGWLRAYVHRFLLGRLLLMTLFAVEELLPRALGRFAAYPMIVVRKKPEQLVKHRVEDVKSRSLSQKAA